MEKQEQDLGHGFETRAATEAALRHLKTLAVEIGPRGSTTDAERRAARYIEEQLNNSGFTATVQGFKSVTSFSWAYGALYLIFVASSLVFLASPPAAFLLDLIALFIYIREVNTLSGLSAAIPRRNSQNVIGKLKPKFPAERKAIVVAHYDSSRAALSFHPKMVAGFRSSFWLMMISMVALTAVYGAVSLTGAVLHRPSFLAAMWYASLPFAFYLAFVVLILAHREIFGRHTHGANDNASGVSVLLEVARELGASPLSKTEVWCVGTGSEEAGTVGMIEFLKQNRLHPANTYIINLDNLGIGQVKYITAEGMLHKYPSSPKLASLAEKAAAEPPALDAAGRPYTLMTTDATAALARGYKAMSIMAMTAEGLLPNWHWITDRIEHVQPQNLATARELVLRILRRLDAGK